MVQKLVLPRIHPMLGFEVLEREARERQGRRPGWLKLKNPTYSQAEGRHELLTRGR